MFECKQGCILSVTILGLAVLGEGSSARADEVAEMAAAAEETDEGGGGVGLNLNLEFATHYVFRGLNLFSDGAQLDQNKLLAPGIAWSIFDTGLTVGWWSAWQVSGKDIGGKIDEGVGAEQDLYAVYEHLFGETLTLGASLYWYFYPAAEESVAGAALPNWLEPAVFVNFSSVLDVGFTVTYMIGVPDGFSDTSYIYLSPSIGKSFELQEVISLDLAASFGCKLFTSDPGEISDNMFDVTLTTVLNAAVGPHTYLAPGIGFAWTNFQKDGTKDPGFADEFVVWGSFNVGADF